MNPENRVRLSRDRSPPLEARTYNVHSEGLIETPVDERGLVDLNVLVKIATETVDPAYTWTSRENDVHHLQWPARRYTAATAFYDTDCVKFRDLVNRKAYVPRVFHNWVHHITEPPSVPTDEVMQYSLDAQRVALSLARTAGLATKLTRHPKLTDKQLQQRLEQEFINYNLFVENAREIPKEFSLLTIEHIEADTVEAMLRANKLLGKLALDRIPILERKIRLAA